MVTETVTIVIRERGANVTSKGIKQVGRSSVGAAQAVRLFTAALVGLSAVLGARQLIEFADAAILIQNRIKVSTANVQDFNAVLFQLREISNGTRTSLQSNAELFQRLNTATRDLGTSQADVLEVVEGLNAAIAVSGSTSTEAASGILQLAQGLASGRFAGDELRSVIENLNPLAQRLADELGVTVGRLREMGAEGLLSAEVVFPALQRAVRGFREELDTVQFTTAQTFNVLKTETAIAVGAINNVLNGSQLLSGGILELADNIGVILVRAFGFFTDGVSVALTAAASFLDVVAELGIRIPSLGGTLSSLAQGFTIFFSFLDTGFQSIRTGVAGLLVSLNLVGDALGVVSAADVTQSFQDFEQAQTDLINSSLRSETALLGLGETIGKAFADGGTADEGAANVRTLAASVGELSDELEKLIVDGRISINEFTGKGAGIDTSGLDAARGDIEAVNRELAILAANPPGRDAGIGSGVSLFDEFVELGEGGEAEEVGNEFGVAFGQAASQGFSSILEGDGRGVLEALADVGANLFQEKLTEVFEELGNSLGDLLQGGLDSLGLGGLSGAFGAAAGAGLGLLAGALQGTTSNVRSGIAQTATQSAQATRGVVAGPTNIPIFEVGAAIEDAFESTNGILLQILDQLRLNGQNVTLALAGSGATAAGDASGIDLSTTTPSLA